jgi:hypothetical protein
MCARQFSCKAMAGGMGITAHRATCLVLHAAPGDYAGLLTSDLNLGQVVAL